MGEFRPSKPGERRGGRQKRTPNKATADIKLLCFRPLADEEHGGGPAISNGYLRTIRLRFQA